MLADTIRILNFDDAVAEQKIIVDRYHPVIVDLKSLGPSVRLWSNRSHAKQVSAAFRPEHKNALTFLGSGDFHHISSLLIAQFEEPITVIVFDHHPDWDIFPPKLGCGAWVSRVLENPRVVKVLLLGMGSDDLTGKGLLTGNLGALKNDRVEIYPLGHACSVVPFRRVSQNHSADVQQGLYTAHIFWKGLPDHDAPDAFLSILQRISTQKVYISIDKDCLRKEDAITNWEEGRLSLESLLWMLGMIKKKFDIVGMDVTGDYSPLQLSGIWKNLCSRWDHPKGQGVPPLSRDVINSVNERTNCRILETVLGPAR